MEPDRLHAPSPPPAIPPDQRHHPQVRRKLSPAAMRSFFRMAAKWDLDAVEQRALLGWPAESTFYKYKAGQVATLSYDTLVRISLLLGIYKDLHILYPEDDLADRWLKLPNSNPMFGGRPAIGFLARTGIDGLEQVRRLLDGRRGGME
jgi:hypothetical protein